MLRQGVNVDGVVMRDVYVEHDPVDLDCSHDGRTRQEFADECDINVLMSRYERTGVLNHYNAQAPAFFDCTELPPDLAGSLELMRQAESAFMTLPAVVRREFDNDPVKFCDFASDPGNVEQMREWGLAKPAPIAPQPLPDASVTPAPIPNGDKPA